MCTCIERVESRVESVFHGFKSLGRGFEVKNMNFSSILGSSETSIFGLFHTKLIVCWRYRGRNRAESVLQGIWQSQEAFSTVCNYFTWKYRSIQTKSVQVFLEYEIHEIHVFHSIVREILMKKYLQEYRTRRIARRICFSSFKIARTRIQRRKHDFYIDFKAI